jgi:hypothetical protein
VHKQGYLPLEWERAAPNIRLAGVKVSVTAVMLTELMSFPHNMMRAMFVIKKLMEGLLDREPQCLNDVSKDLRLPKFTDPDKQNIVHILDDLVSYFLLRSVPDSFKLVLAMSAVVDGYTSQWIKSVYKDQSSYEQFRETIIEFLWGPQAQARWRCALYQSMYDRTKDGSMTAHFLCHSAIANNLIPRLTASDIVEIISGLYPAYVQRCCQRGYGQFVML